MEKLKLPLKTLKITVILAFMFFAVLPAYAWPLSVLLDSSCTNAAVTGDSIAISDKSDMKTPLSGTLNISQSAQGLYVNSTPFASAITLSSPYPLTYNGIRYSGTLVFTVTASGFSVKNIVDSEQYLKGVLKGEMSPSWPLEALKAQAVLARTYIACAAIAPRHGEADVCSEGHCQVYKGLNSGGPSIDAAVDSTSGMILTWQGRPASVFFHSDSGGFTTTPSRVWGGADAPYIRAIAEPIPYSSPNSAWEANLSISHIENRLMANGINVGNILEIAPIKRDESGRVLLLEIRGTASTSRLTGHKLRSILGSDKLRSTMFEITSGKAQLNEIPRAQTSLKSYPVSSTSPKPIKLDKSQIPKDNEEKLVWFTKHKIFSISELMQMLSKPEKINEYLKLAEDRIEGRVPMQQDRVPLDSANQFTDTPASGEAIIFSW